MKTHRILTMAQAISEGIAQEMTRDPNVFVMGEDIGTYGGIFGATGGLLEKFGKERVMDTPISETAFIGAATGAAILSVVSSSFALPSGSDMVPLSVEGRIGSGNNYAAFGVNVRLRNVHQDTNV